MGNEDLKSILGEIIETALEAEKRGVVIDWKSMTFKCYNIASNVAANSEPEPVQEELLDATPAAEG